MAKIKCPFRYPARSREAMVDYIENVGGYSAFNSTTYPLVWSVKAYPDLGFDDLWKRWISDHHGYAPDEVVNDPVARELYRKMASDIYDEHLDQHGEPTQFWYWGQESAANDLLGDDCTYSTLWDGTNVGAKWTFCGRSGGYAALKEFDNYSIEGVSNSSLVEGLRLTGEDEQWCFADVRKLYKFCVEMDHFLTSDKAESQVQWYACWALFINLLEADWTAHTKSVAWLKNHLANDPNDLPELDDMVDAYKADEAVDINQEGVLAQVSYLIDQGRSPQAIADELGIELPNWTKR